MTDGQRVSTIAFLGLGRMGAAMAARLIDTGYELVLWNRSSAGYERLASELRCDTQLRIASSPAEAASGADLVVTMLSDGYVTQEVLFGPSGAVETLKQGAIVCDMGTSGVETARSIARRLESTGIRFLDSPVSGSVQAVRAKTMLVMVGGRPEVFGEVEHILRALGSAVLRVGSAGSGQVAKLAVNAVLHVLDASLSESLALAEAGGVSVADMLEVLGRSVVATPFLMYKRSAFEQPGVEPVAFTVDLMLKDLKLIDRFSHEVGSATPLASAATSLISKVSEAGFGDRDMSYICAYHRANSVDGRRKSPSQEQPGRQRSSPTSRKEWR